MNVLTSLTDYFRSSRAELQKISWPSREATIRYSALVMGVSIAIAAFFAALDFGLGRVVDLAVLSRQSIGPTASPTAQPKVAPTTAPVTTTPASSVPGLDIKAEDTTLTPKPSTAPSPTTPPQTK